VREWKLCGLHRDFCEGLEALWFTKSWLSLRCSSDAARLFGATWSSKIACSSPTQEMRIAGRYCKSKASKRRYISRRFRCAWHMEQPIEVPEREERLCRKASEEIPESHHIPKADAAQGNIPASINSRQ
jgi:hypothetical protein